MKLIDEGTLLDEEVEEVVFNGKTYQRLKVTYEAVVGSDTWYFYINPKSYALEVYQFYHDESKNDGEYILLEELETFKNMRIPKIRKWYMNNDKSHLGDDVLISIDAVI